MRPPILGQYQDFAALKPVAAWHSHSIFQKIIIAVGTARGEPTFTRAPHSSQKNKKMGVELFHQNEATIPSPTRERTVPLRFLAGNLKSAFPLSGDEMRAVYNLPFRLVEIRADKDITSAGDHLSRCCLVIEGMACTYKLSGDGSRQIVNFHIPGDAPDLHSLYLPVLDISMRTITPCKVSFVQHKAIQELCAQSPRIAGALWRHILIDAASCRERMTSIGRRSATCRLAHLLCELVLRYRASGLARMDTASHFR